jgi:hypothetical protein
MLIKAISREIEFTTVYCTESETNIFPDSLPLTSSTWMWMYYPMCTVCEKVTYPLTVLTKRKSNNVKICAGRLYASDQVAYRQ